MLTESEYKTLKEQYDIYLSAILQHFERTGKNYITPEDRENLPPAVANDDISSIEVYEFVNNPPDTYFFVH